ncbi:flavin-containing monooxygenase 5-like [Ornithorhynchus anatinus]|nr:flavin-containing monooxygenase 5-like [Ornithorhynchus anatinus]
MSCYSDFPVPDHFPNYMHNSQVLEYLRMFATHFDLLKYIRFKTEVVSVRKRPDFPSSGRWEVTTEAAGEKESHVFDGILVCNGHHTDPHLPLDSFPGIEKFRGRYFHSREYKSPEGFRGKRILVIGIGNSGADIAGELSRVAEQVYLSTRRGAWILHRVWEHGYPLDISFFTRVNHLLRKTLPSRLIDSHLEKILNSRFNHAHYGLLPQHSPLSQHPTVSDGLPDLIISGKIVVKGNVEEFAETDAVFEDGTREGPLDVVVFATGYAISFPFLEGVIPVRENQVSLYKLVFPPALEKPTLAVIGLVQPLGIVLPLTELQCRWAARVFKGLSRLPSTKIMTADIDKRKEAMEKRYVRSGRHTIQVDHVEYADEVAEQIGARPGLLRLLLRDPALALHVALGPCTPFQYRLVGPGRWPPARHTILTQHQRVLRPLSTRRLGPTGPPAPGPAWGGAVRVGLAFLAGLVSYYRSGKPSAKP